MSNLIYSGKLSELKKTLDLAAKKEPKISLYTKLIKSRINLEGFKTKFPQTYKDGLTRCLLLPDGNPGNFIFNTEKTLFVLSYSPITRDYVTNDKSKFLIHAYLMAFYRYENGSFKDFGTQISLGQVYNDELDSSKAKLLSAKARSSVVRISKMSKSSEIESYMDSIFKET